MKKTLFYAATLLFTTGVSAQTYLYEDFEAGGTTWTNVDQDGDTYKWAFVDYDSGDGQGKVATSASWNSTAGPLTPDNYLISPAIALGTNNLTLHFKVKGQDPSYSQEHYAVYVTTASDIATISGSTPVLEETLPANTTDYINKTVDLSAFSGQTVYVTFRHFNVSDMFKINIDDVVIGKIEDSKLVSVNIPSGVEPGNFSITGTIQNNGTEAIDSLFVTYDAGAGPIVDTIASLNVVAGATYNFTHSIPLAVAAGQNFAISVCATIPDDNLSTNNCMNDAIDFAVTAANSADKYVVVEEKTGTWCGYCPYGTVELDKLAANEPKAILIAIHNNDPMVVSTYDAASDYFPGQDPTNTTYPYSAIDRVIGDHAAYSTLHVNERKPLLAPASISFDEAKFGGNTITITPKVNMVTGMTGDFRVAVVLTEEQVKGTATDNSWKQHNYFTSTINNEDLIAIDGTNWKNLPEYVDQVAVFGGYNHVARALGDNQINGAAGSLPGTLVSGQSYTHTYTFTIDPSWVLSNMHAVAMLVNNTTGEVYNAMESPITGTTGIEENTLSHVSVSAFPNPSNGNTNIKVELDKASTVSINVYNVVGKLVYQVPAEQLATGTKVYPMNLDVKSGVYFAHVSVNGAKQIIKLNIVK